MIGFEPTTTRFPKAVLYQTETHPVVVVPIISNPELPRGLQQLSCLNKIIITTTCGACQTVPSVPNHICELYPYQ